MPTVRTCGRLPHWEENHAIYFVTFRLADSLPQSVLQAFESERLDILATAKQAGRPLSISEEIRLDKLFSARIQSKLDTGAGSCVLSNPSVAAIVAGVLQHFDSTRYRLYAWCVMPNHVHSLFRLLPGYSLARVIHAWKSYTANRSNRLLARTGQFWQREYYDHLVRTEDEFYRIVNYIAENPKKARLQDWRWTGVNLKA